MSRDRQTTIWEHAEEVEDRSSTLTEVDSMINGKKRQPLLAVTMEKIADEGNLREAFEEVKANDGTPGADGKSIADVEAKLSTIIPELKRQLLEETYEPGPTRRVWIPKSGGGQRGLGIPTVETRMVHQAMLRIMQPEIDPEFHPNSHGFRPGRGCHTAIDAAKSYIEEGYEYVVDIDLANFFDTVNHNKLVNKLEERIPDKRVTRLIRVMLRAEVVMPGGMPVVNEEGIPQGGPLSPLLSNIVLHELDEELHRRGHRFVRYADDNNIYVRSERAGKRVMESVTRFIEKRLKLKVNREKSAVSKSGERHFLGFHLARNAMTGEVIISLSERSKKRIDEKIVKLIPRNWGNSLGKCIERINSYLRGWFGYFRSITSNSILRTLDAHIRRRLRALKLKQWKRKRTIARALISLGVSKGLAWSIYKGKRSLWALSHHPAVDRGLRNAFFAERGLVSLADLWQQYHSPAGPAPTRVGYSQVETPVLEQKVASNNGQ